MLANLQKRAGAGMRWLWAHRQEMLNALAWFAETVLAFIDYLVETLFKQTKAIIATLQQMKDDRDNERRKKLLAWGDQARGSGKYRR